MATVIQQGDKYNLPVKIKQGTEYITPTDVDDVRIQVGSYLREYSKSELTFNSSTNEWYFPITEEMSQSFQDNLVDLQVGIKDGSVLRYSPTQSVLVGQSIIKEDWT